MNEKPMWIQKILEAKAVVEASRGHGGYPTPKETHTRIPVKVMPSWWDAPIADTEEVLDFEPSKKCGHKNIHVVHLLFSSVTECKDCGEKVEP